MPPRSKCFERKKKKLHRLIAILRMLDKRERVTTSTLIDRFAVDKRTVLRDFNDLNDAGFTIRFNDYLHHYEFVDPDYTLQDLELNKDELRALFLGTQMVRILGRPFEEASKSLIRKASKDTGRKTRCLANSLKENSNRFLVCKDDDLVGMEYGDKFDQIKAQYDAINAAMDDGLELKITYVAMESQDTTQRTIAPYGLIFKYGRWYTIGHCNLRGEIRMFALDCIKDTEMITNFYQMPSDFNIESYFESAWNIIRYGEPLEVVLKFTKETARWIKRDKWHSTQVIEDQEDGSIIFRVTIQGTQELKWWAYRWIPFCEVLSPPELRNEVMEDLRTIMKTYEG